MTFSKNIGLATTPILQTNGMEEKLKNRIRNVVILNIKPIFTELFKDDIRNKLIFLICDKFGYRIDETQYNLNGFKLFLEKNIFCNWFYTYDFIEILYIFFNKDKTFKNNINNILKEENSAFQLIDSGDIVPITDDIEIQSIEETLQAPLQNVIKHIKTAIQHFKEEPKDYRNSIKESISAVEAMCCEITGDKKATLGVALKKLKSLGIDVHPSLKKGFECIYGYTSDESGIRHNLDIDSIEATFDDAKFMLVSCCAFVNYLIGKQNEIS